MKHHSRTSAMFCMDYMYMTKKPSEEELMHPILVIKERVTDGVWAVPLIRKGTFKSNVVSQVTSIINSVGSPKVIIKSDQEPSMVDIQMETRKELWAEVLKIMNDVKDVKEGKVKMENMKCTGGEVILENSPVGESQSNGYIENGIK